MTILQQTTKTLNTRLQNSSSSSANSSNTGKSPTSTLSGLTKTPQFPPPHSKYRVPFTLPSFFPVGSSSLTPTQAPIPPGISPTSPTNATSPRRASLSAGSNRHRLPTAMFRADTSAYEAATLDSSIEGARGSKRPSFWDFFHAKTLSVRFS
ncbi:hypothetical protein KC367_g58 [Hortaea werneckii]|nr:hypothetical protein KC367_g58 [Hortaea werneckii]